MDTRCRTKSTKLKIEWDETSADLVYVDHDEVQTFEVLRTDGAYLVTGHRTANSEKLYTMQTLTVFDDYGFVFAVSGTSSEDPEFNPYVIFMTGRCEEVIE